MMSLWDALRMNMMISYQELVRTFLSSTCRAELTPVENPMVNMTIKKINKRSSITLSYFISLRIIINFH